MENISAAKIQQYIQGISGKSDWSVHAWQEWAALEKIFEASNSDHPSEGMLCFSTVTEKWHGF